mgnify:FL=1
MVEDWRCLNNDESEIEPINLVEVYNLRLPSDFHGAQLDTTYIERSDELYEKLGDTFLGMYDLHHYKLKNYTGFTGVFYHDMNDRYNLLDLQIFNFNSPEDARIEHSNAITKGIEEYWEDNPEQDPDQESYGYDYYYRPRRISEEESGRLSSHEGYYYFDTDSNGCDDCPDFMYIAFRMGDNCYQLIYDRIYDNWTMEQAFERGREFAESLIHEND